MNRATTTLVTLTSAARRLNVPTSYVRGLVDGMGLSLRTAGRARVLSPGQFRAVERRVAGTRAERLAS